METVSLSHRPTRAAEFLALDLSNTFVCESARAGAAGTAGLDGVGTQVVGQPLQITVTNKWVLGQVTAEQIGRWTEEERVRGGKSNTHENCQVRSKERAIANCILAIAWSCSLYRHDGIHQTRSKKID